MKKTLKILVIVIVCAMFMASCARQPTQKRSANLIQHYFKKYAKKYPASVYGSNGVKQVEITSQSEIHKNLVSVESFITLADGSIQRIYATLEKGPVGWRFVSWENATGM